MKVIYWNIRGIANEDSRNSLRNFCLTHSPDIVFILEPMPTPEASPFNYGNSCNLRFVATNNRGDMIFNCEFVVLLILIWI